jgi:integrase
MPTIPITEKTVRLVLSRPKPASDVDYTDNTLPGFTLRHFKSGRGGYVFRYRWPDPVDPTQSGLVPPLRARRLALGLTGEIDADAAREKARKAAQALIEGRDPAARPPVSKLDRNITLGQAVKLWHDDMARRGCVTAAKRYRVMTRHILPRLGADRMLRARDDEGRIVDAINVGECRDALRAMQDDGLTGAVTDAQLNLHGVFALARAEGYLDSNPMAGALDLDELTTVWRAADHLEAPTRAAVRLLILLGQRRGEVGGMRRSELIDVRDVRAKLFNKDEREAAIAAGVTLCWVLPIARQKSRRRKAPRDHIIPLPPQAIALIQAQKGMGQFVFSNCGGHRPIGNWSEAKAILNKHAQLSESWTLRDLRASLVTGFATHLEAMTATAGRLCNHSPGKTDGITAAVYERARRLHVVYKAACQWADLIEAAVARQSGTNVLPMTA